VIPAVSLVNATAGYAGRPVLRGINLTIGAGEKVAVMGRSGSGKSTLLNMIYDANPERVSLIPQAASLVQNLSVFHNVYMGRLDRHSSLYNLRMLVSAARREREGIAALVDALGLQDKLFERAGALSGGQQQRTSIGRAIYNGRPVLVGDEPVSALDRVQASAMLDLLSTRHETLVIALHDVQLALQHTDRILVLEHGAIVRDAPSHLLTPADLAPHFSA
jgi:phosphonate transport system ATP-binding protein